MLCSDLIQVIETTYPSDKAMEWDNVGLLVGRCQKEIQKVYVALDATEEVIAQAVQWGADMLLTHHPILFSPIKQVTDDNLVGGRILQLVQNDICYYAMHTNYDVLRMADLSSDILGLEVVGSLDENGIGRVGNLENPMTVLECCELIKERFQLKSVKVYGNLQQMASCVAISPGSGKHMSELAIKKGADVFVTAEIDHHEGLDANAEGLAIIDAGHYGLEHIFIHDMVEYFRRNFKQIEVLGAEISHPFHIV